MYPLKSSCVAASLLILAGCGAGRDYQQPTAAAQAAWTAPAPAEATVPLSQWWRSFADPQLDRLIAAALAQNLDLRRALARIDETRASRRAVRWLGAPDIDVGGSAERRHFSANVPGPSSGITETYEAGFDLSWEIDLAGGLRRGVQAQSADLAARQAGYHEVATLIAAETARAYIDLLAAQEQLLVATADIADLGRMRAVIAARVAAGNAPSSALAQADTTRLLVAAGLPEFELRRTNALTRLATLLSVPPAEALGATAADSPFAHLPSVARIPVPGAMFAAGLPSDLIRRRPDLRRAEREIAAAVARVGVAERDLYPRFSLTGSFGLESDAPGDFFERGSRFWSIGPAVRWPLLSIFRVRAQIAAADARAEQAALTWQQAVLAAFAEVEDALAGVARGQERARIVGEALSAQERALAAVRLRYERGADDLFALLVEQRNASAVRQQAVEARRTSALRVVALAKALGGGWDPAATPHAQSAR